MTSRGPGHGATFLIDLPVMSPEDVHAATAGTIAEKIVPNPIDQHTADQNVAVDSSAHKTPDQVADPTADQTVDEASRAHERLSQVHADVFT